MAIRPGAEEIIRGVQRSITTQLVPARGAPYTVAQAGYAAHLLSALLAQQDGAAQQLVEDNAALRTLAAAAAALLGEQHAGLRGRLSAAAGGQEPDVRLSTLTAANDRLRGLIVRVVPLATAADAPAGLMDLLLDALEASARRRLIGSL